MRTRVRFACVVMAGALMATLAMSGVAWADGGIQIVKSSDPESLVGSGDVTYSYVLTNSTASEAPTASAIGSITVTDDKIDTVTMDPTSDTNGNGLLDEDENWTYSATAHLTATTTNVGTVTGVRVSDGATVTASNPMTVEVTKKASDTSSTTEGGELPQTATHWYDLLVAGGVLVFVGALGTLLVLRRGHA